jgi:hypothetical protein
MIKANYTRVVWDEKFQITVGKSPLVKGKPEKGFFKKKGLFAPP